jgi:hypothetical protein
MANSLRKSDPMASRLDDRMFALGKADRTSRLAPWQARRTDRSMHS